MVDITQFLASFSNDQRFFLNLPVFWTVSITGVSEGSINSVLSYAGEKWKATVSPSSMTKGGNILVAQSVTTPNESSVYSSLDGGKTIGGYLAPIGLSNRANFVDRSFSVNFLETENDLEHNYFRPWAIAVGIKGLIEQGANLKATMELRQYTNKGQLMKGFRFKKVIPTGVEALTLDYESTDFKVKSVTFICQDYEQL